MGITMGGWELIGRGLTLGRRFYISAARPHLSGEGCVCQADAPVIGNFQARSSPAPNRC